MSARRRPLPAPKPFWGMVERRGPHLFNIPHGRAFADAFADGLIERFGGERLQLARTTILVPNSRAAQAIQAAFVRRAAKGLLLPRMVAIGDPDLGEKASAAIDPVDAAAIPPAVEPLQRQMMLARLIQQDAAVNKLGSFDSARAMRLAAQLAAVLDELTIARKTPADLRQAVPDQLSLHWEASLELFGLIARDWPRELSRIGCIDLADRRNRQLDGLARLWRDQPPAGPVIAAGISTAAPAIAGLLKTVARLPQGEVVLSGLDTTMTKEEWQALAEAEEGAPAESHPQFHLMLLLDALDATREDVDEWRWGKQVAELAERSRRVARAMAIPEFTGEWASMPAADRTLKNVHALELENPADEAQAIALALRHAVERPGRTAALITPDRALAVRVSALLRRWGIEADDSAGQPLSAMPAGALLLALADAAASRFAPVPLLTLIKHPLAMAGDARLAWLDGARALDLALRGPQPLPGLDGIQAFLASPADFDTAKRQAALARWPAIEAVLGPFEQAMVEAQGLAPRLAALRQGAQALAGDAAWSGPDGRAAADLLAALSDHAAEGPRDAGLAELGALLRDAMDATPVRPPQGGHPRVFIWGLLEARLQRTDLAVVAGLNEGAWPQLSGSDPWLAPAMRRRLGLAGLERRIGLSAHDLAGALSAPEVLLTRAKRDARAVTKPSRFWLRLEAFCGGFAPPSTPYGEIARALDRADGARATRPAPSPPAGERPRQISVTAVDRLKADPYGFYARSMLRVAPLEAPGAEPSARWRGTFLHGVLSDWGALDGFAAGALVPRLKGAFETSGLHPVVRAMWLPRFEQAAEFMEARVQEERSAGRQPLIQGVECDGSLKLCGVTLSGKADRIDRLADGTLAIVDYKTGQPPSKKAVSEGFALQLGLLGALAEGGAFEGIRGRASVFEYWSQRRKDGRYGEVALATGGRGGLAADALVPATLRHFAAIADQWLTGNAAFEPKLHPEYANSDYDQLSRLEEWMGRNG